MTIKSTKPALDAATLEHYGVLGMKWGRTRARANSSQIRSARARVNLQSAKIGVQRDLVRTASTPQAKAQRKSELSKTTTAFLKNPDRVTAVRLTRGEKVATALLFTPVTAATLIGTTSATSRRIERKQELGKYNKK